MFENDEHYMSLALDQAREAQRAGEVPVGAVLVHTATQRVLASGRNRNITDCDPTAHAEIVALRSAARSLANYRLTGTSLFVTIEPCAMCAGAIVHARLDRLVYGADDPKGGAVRSCFSLLSNPQLNHTVQVTGGILMEECAALLQTFFACRR